MCFHDDNRHLSLLLIFIGCLPPFTEIDVEVYKSEWRQVNKKKEADRDGIKQKGDKIGMGYMTRG